MSPKVVKIDLTPDDHLENTMSWLRNHHAIAPETKKTGTIKNGVYKVYGRFLNKEDEMQLHSIGRMLVNDNTTLILEDHHGFLEAQFLNGPVDQQKVRRWYQLTHSPYMEVVPDSDVPKHPDPEPETIYELYDEQGHRHHLLVYSDINIWMDHEKLSESEIEHIFKMIRSNTYHLVPKS